MVVKAWRSRIPGGEVVEWAQAAPGTGCRASIAVRYGCEKAKAGFLGDSVPYSLRRELGALQGYYERRKPVSYYCLFTLYDDGLTGRHPHSDLLPELEALHTSFRLTTGDGRSRQNRSKSCRSAGLSRKVRCLNLCIRMLRKTCLAAIPTIVVAGPILVVKEHSGPWRPGIRGIRSGAVHDCPSVD